MTAQKEPCLLTQLAATGDVCMTVYHHGTIDPHPRLRAVYVTEAGRLRMQEAGLKCIPLADPSEEFNEHKIVAKIPLGRPHDPDLDTIYGKFGMKDAARMLRAAKAPIIEMREQDQARGL